VKRFVLAFGCVLAGIPGVASAALKLSFSPENLVLTKGAIPAGEQFVDLVFTETGPTTNEGLFAYDLYIRRDNPGMTLLRAEKPTDNWVFSAPGASFQQADVPGNNPPAAIIVNAIGDLLGATQDIVSGTKAARIFFTIDPNAAPGAFHIFLDQSPGTTLFVSGDTGEAIPVDISSTLTIAPVPEPACLALSAVGGGGMLILRRRRAA
jgi:hypothetical protein